IAPNCVNLIATVNVELGSSIERLLIQHRQLVPSAQHPLLVDTFQVVATVQADGFLPGRNYCSVLGRARAGTGFVDGVLEAGRIVQDLNSIEVKGIDAFAWGPNDLAQSMGLPGQPEHPDVLEAQRQIAERIHAAGGKMNSDITATINLPNLIVDGAQQFLAANQ
ncbi:MAG: hypothetical protein IIC22_08370, partial [Chloroflexi bacterium]|nr:hypothetical protein [Chloroflexota bacterium]